MGFWILAEQCCVSALVRLKSLLLDLILRTGDPYPTFNTPALLRNLHPQHHPFYNGPLCGFADIVIVFFKVMLQNCLMQGDTEN